MPVTESVQYEPGDYVVDVEDPNPDLAVVIKIPDAKISEWRDDEDSDETVADRNPNYNKDDNVVLVSYVKSGLEERWPEWRENFPDNLYGGVVDNSVKFYAFPSERLLDATLDEIAEGLN